MVTTVEVVTAAGVPVGYGIGTLGAFRFARWAIEFFWKRLDIRHDRLSAKEQALEQRYDARLRHLETELGKTQKAMTLLLNDVATRDPSNPVLQRVAELLHPLDPGLPMNSTQPPAPDLESLVRQAKRTGEQ